jgi:hypothetical protein
MPDCVQHSVAVFAPPPVGLDLEFKAILPSIRRRKTAGG